MDRLSSGFIRINSTGKEIKFHRQFGVGLMEILISILVLSIGLLGLAGLQAVGLKNNSQSFDRSYAVFLANNILDRIRANPAANYKTDFKTAPAVATNKCEASECSADELRDYDLAQWKCLLGGFNENNFCQNFSTMDFNSISGNFEAMQIEGLLRNGEGAIQKNGATNYTINIRWSDPTKTNVDNTSTYSMVADIGN